MKKRNIVLIVLAMLVILAGTIWYIKPSDVNAADVLELEITNQFDEPTYIIGNEMGVRYDVTLKKSGNLYEGQLPCKIVDGNGERNEQINFKNGVGIVRVYGDKTKATISIPDDGHSTYSYSIEVTSYCSAKLEFTPQTDTEGTTKDNLTQVNIISKVCKEDVTFTFDVGGCVENDIKFPVEFMIHGMPEKIKLKEPLKCEFRGETKDVTSSVDTDYVRQQFEFVNGDVLIIKDVPMESLIWFASMDSNLLDERYGFTVDSFAFHTVFGSSGGLNGNYSVDPEKAIIKGVLSWDYKQLKLSKQCRDKGIVPDEEYIIKIKGTRPSYVHKGESIPVTGSYPYVIYNEDDEEVSKGKMEFNSEGIGTIKLKDMQYAIVGEKLWEGPQYQYHEFKDHSFTDDTFFEVVREEDDKYRPEFNRNVGRNMFTLDLFNFRKFTGKINLKKTVNGEGADLDKEFTFKIKLEDGATDIPTSYYYNGSKTGYLSFDENWEAELTLKGGEEISIYSLPVGAKYTITEEDYKADGYVTESKYDEDTVSETNRVVEFINEKKIVEINKFDSTGKKKIAGVKLQLKDKTGKLIEEWTTTEESHRISATLAVGGKYILSEVEALDGYVKADDLEFEVENKLGVQTVNFINDYTKVSISKIDEKGNFVPGAKLVIKDEAGNEIEKWTSSKETYKITGKLIAGKKYIIEEIEAPEGYEKAEKSEFVVSTDGKEDVIKIVNNKIIIEDPVEPEEPKEDPVEPKEDPVEPKEDPVEPKEDPAEPTNEETMPVNPKTSDNIYIVVLALACSVLGYIAISKINKNKTK